MNILLQMTLAFLVVFGIFSLVQNISWHLMSFKKDKNIIVLVPLNKADEDVELIVRGIVSRMNHIAFGMNFTVLLVDYGLDDERRNICDTMCRRSSILKLCPADKLSHYLRK